MWYGWNVVCNQCMGVWDTPPFWEAVAKVIPKDGQWAPAEAEGGQATWVRPQHRAPELGQCLSNLVSLFSKNRFRVLGPQAGKGSEKPFSHTLDEG